MDDAQDDGLTPAKRLRRRLRRLLAPVGPERFFAEHFGRKVLHLTGDPERGADVATLAEFNRLLNMTSIWSDRTLKVVMDQRGIRPETYCRPAVDADAPEVMRPVPSQVTRWIRRGASVVLNGVGELSDGLSETSAALRAATGAGVQANLYFSRRGRQAFEPHFDTHEVFALHCVGEKVWRIFANRAEVPTQRSVLADNAQGTKHPPGQVVDEVLLRPGDLLYIPRGQFHDALAGTDPTIHVSFAASMPSGANVLRLLGEEGRLDTFLRQDLPLGLTPEALAAASGRIGDRLAAMTRDPRFLGALASLLRAALPPFDRYDIAGALAAPVAFRAERNLRLDLGKDGDGAAVGRFGRVAVPAALTGALQWAIAAGDFDRARFAAALPALDGDAIDELVKLGLVDVI
ncbi:MAG: cupin domain-containing protein [Alphaproteobacteria bacterium]